MVRRERIGKISLMFLSLAAILARFILAPDAGYALCATVKIEIRQELTLERQAFDAHMRINNGLSDISIENVGVTVLFFDEAGDPVLASSDPDDTNASFFIRLDRMDNIESVDGNGTVAPETSADIHWLIIPAPGASNGLESGTMYFVGATLAYTAAGQSESIEVTPDYIFVKPMPQLVLDYFLPTDVYGDDAWSPAVEAPVPFYLGLRISNKGEGYARSLKVESAQPKIVANETGLLIGFQIDGSTVNGQPATNSLLADFGDIAPNTAGMARWIMSCSLSGRFVEFDAEFSHADELGGKLTSLIGQDDVRTHFLVRSVYVDAEGRDGLEDFLANDDEVYRVFESDNVETEVTDQSATAALVAQGGAYRLTAAPTQGFMYARVPDPTHGNMLIKETIRSDGKRIKPANVWFSKTRTGSGPWQYFLNIFDFNTNGIYNITMQSLADIDQAPVIMFIPERSRVEGQQLSFIVEASDPNGTIPQLSAERLPVGAAFTDQANGSGIFDWVPSPGQAGRYVVRFIASDGVLDSSRQAVIRIFSQDDSDGDGMLDSWEMEHFGTLDRDGAGDFDGDGISDLEEFANGLDPEASQSVPSVPEIVSPQNGEHIDHLAPDLVVANSSDPEGDEITYTFEVFSDDTFKTLLFSGTAPSSQAGTTTWTVPEALADNAFSYWRVRASDATGSSVWAHGQFFTDTLNDAPSAPGIGSPANGTDVDRPQPGLVVTNARDPEGEPVVYHFEVYADEAMSQLVASAPGIVSGEDYETAWTVDTALEEGTAYYWRAVAEDGRGAATPGPLASFWVNTANTAPAAPVLSSPLDGAEIDATHVDLSVTTPVDPDGNDITCLFEIDTDPSFAGASKLVSGPISPMAGNTMWSLDALVDNTLYYWRVKSSDGTAESPWVTGRFFVNTVNEAPPVPELRNPGMDAWVNTRTPVLSVHPVQDPDQDILFYRFELYADADFTQTVGYVETDESAWAGVSALAAGAWHYWRVQAVDEHGIPGEWSETGEFFVKVNGIDLPPQLTFLSPSEPIHTNAQGILLRWSDADPDSSAVIALYYDTDDSGADGTPIAEGIEEDPDGTEDDHTWDISGLEGTYYIYAVIDDAHSSETVYCPFAITVDHTPPAVTAAPAGGTFAAPVAVTLTADEQALIYYTLDGSEPDIGADLYTEPLALSESATLRFMAVDTAGNQCPSSSESYTFETDGIAVTASTDKGRLLGGLRVYAYTEGGSYAGTYATTDGAGRALFDPAQFAAGSYRFRVDYLGSPFWSQTVALPDTRSIPVVIPEEAVAVTVRTAAGVAEGVQVYLFSQTGAYLGTCLVTDGDGQVVFNLPVGMTFSFRADMLGHSYWSDATTVTGGAVNAAPVDAGGGRLSVAVCKSEEVPITGVRVYLFNTSETYLGRYATTDDLGRAAFDLPSGDYRLRVDYLGYPFWSEDAPVTTDTTVTVALPHQSIEATVEGRFQESAEALEGIGVYLYTGGGSYLGTVKQTDSQGRVFFDLPERAYKVRADYLGRQYWSETVTWQDPVVAIPLADARVTVTGAGYPLSNVRVYLFSETGSYLGRFAETDGHGQCLFRLPEGAYRFRADHMSNQFWTGDETLAADQFHDIGLSTGGGSFCFTVLSAADQPLAGATGCLFNADGAYLGRQGTTDDNGQLAFDLSNGTYRLRVSHLGHEFWSAPVQVPDLFSAEMTIAHTPVDVTVITAAGPAEAARVYLFSAQGAYLGRYLETDAQGQARFDLPAGASYTFRADLSGNSYWSDALLVPETAPAAAHIDAGGGSLQLVVHDGAGGPMAGLDVYLYSGDDRYLGRQAKTDDTGTAAFEVPQGEYKLRADYLGYSYWTDAVLVAADTQQTLDIGHQAVTVSVQGRYQGTVTALGAVRIYLFTPTGSYLGQYQETGGNGTATFNLPARDYLLRADHMGRPYWSNTFNGSTAAQSIEIPMADARVGVTGAGLPRQGVSVYVYSESGAYLNTRADTDESGAVVFRLPADSYRFRADYQTGQYWSETQTLGADLANEVVISVGGGTFSLSVGQDATTPMAGIRCYVFNGDGAYVGLYGATDDQGRARFDLADGTYRFRADYLGYAHWSEPATVPDQMAAGIDIPHQDTAVTFTGAYLGTDDPLAGQRVYLYSPSGGYLGLNQLTDDNGRAIFRLPGQSYKIRADYLGKSYWSQPFQFQDVAVQVPQGAVDLQVRRGQAGLAAIRVYLFSGEGSYLGRYALTDSDGWVAFILPEGIYRFRADVEGAHYWASDVAVALDQTATIEIDTEQ